MIDLAFLNENPDLAGKIKLEVTASDLIAFGKYLHDKALSEADKLMPDEKEEYLSPQQMADILKVSLVTLWSWDKRGITAPVHVGVKKYYRRSDLEKIMTR
jgi:hypothetical protein